MCFNFLILVFGAIPYFVKHGYYTDLMWIGSSGGAIATFGMVLLQNAFSEGPCGPVTALLSLSSPSLVVIMAFYN